MIAIFAIAVVAYRGVWRNWEQYHTTMLFFGLMELIYNSVAKENNYFLWKIAPELFPSRIPLIGLYVFIIFPAATLLFLSKMPQDIIKQGIHVAKWVGIFTFVEALGSIYNKIQYINNWSLWHSFIFNIILFSGLILHHRKPLIAYILFLIVTIIGIWAFKIPV
jgi:hypothetical protein